MSQANYEQSVRNKLAAIGAYDVRQEDSPPERDGFVLSFTLYAGLPRGRVVFSAEEIGQTDKALVELLSVSRVMEAIRDIPSE